MNVADALQLLGLRQLPSYTELAIRWRDAVLALQPDVLSANADTQAEARIKMAKIVEAYDVLKMDTPPDMHEKPFGLICDPSTGVIDVNKNRKRQDVPWEW